MTRQRVATVALAALLLGASFVTGCQRTFLPPIPDDWEAGSSAPQDPLAQRSAASDTGVAHSGEEAAYALLVALEEALEVGAVEVLFRGLSSETRLLLDRWHPEGAEAALESRRVHWDGSWWNLALEDWLLGEGPVSALRSLGPTESSTIGPRRIEYMHPDSERPLVVIREGDEWRVHRTTIPVTYLSEETP